MDSSDANFVYSDISLSFMIELETEPLLLCTSLNTFNPIKPEAVLGIFKYAKFVSETITHLGVKILYCMLESLG